MKLSRNNLKNITPTGKLIIPHDKVFDLPEKVLQFGTGVLLRGLPDYFINKANQQGVFNGRVLVVKSTGSGGVDAFDEQDGLYTHCIRGIEADSIIEENIINASISRVLSANTQWREILDAAANPLMEIVISNTTEVGITLVDEDINASPPVSFPGKLLAFLYERFRKFDGDPDKGMVIVPTELITDNGNLLKDMLLQLAMKNGLQENFLNWLSKHNHFCNSLVDRIVPGKPGKEAQKNMEETVGYTDDLMIMSEVYRLWAIETADPKVRKVLSFGDVDEGVIIAEDIEVFKELKLRILNGSHTFSCGLAVFCGFKTVKEAMENKIFSSFITGLMMEEIAPSIAGDEISVQMAREFANKVIDRYRNPHIDHQWISISVQYSLKMRTRNVPVIKKYYERFGATPRYMSLGFAAFLLFMRSKHEADGKYYGEIENNSYTINDENAAIINEKWRLDGLENFVQLILSEEKLWGMDLSSLPGFSKTVGSQIHSLKDSKALDILEKITIPAIA